MIVPHDTMCVIVRRWSLEETAMHGITWNIMEVPAKLAPRALTTLSVLVIVVILAIGSIF